MRYALAGMLMVAVLAAAQDPAPAGEIAGTVNQAESRRGGAGIPLAGVVVTIAGPALTSVRTVVTSATGEYSVSRLPAGTYTAWFQKVPPAQTATRAGIVVANARVAVDVELPVVVIRDFAPPRADLRPGEVGVVIPTTSGEITIAVDTVRAPVTSTNFLKYVDGGFYGMGRFHRATRPDNYTPVLPNRPAMAIIQGGIYPAKRDSGFPPIPLERTSVTGLKHVVGTVSMARGTPDSATSDFFICLDDQPSLDFGGRRFDDEQGAAAFGRVVEGLDVVRKIQQAPTHGQSLTPPIVMFGAFRLPSK